MNLGVLRYFPCRRTRHLLCERNECDEFTIAHLGFLQYSHYVITVQFFGLESFHQRYNIKDLTIFVSICGGCGDIGAGLMSTELLFSVHFQFKTYSPDFTQIEISFRFIFLLFSFIVTVSVGRAAFATFIGNSDRITVALLSLLCGQCWFRSSLRRYPYHDWSIEQKWMNFLLPSLAMFDSK